MRIEDRLDEAEVRVLTLAQGSETAWVVTHRVGERTLDDQRTVRVVDGLYARGYLHLTRCGPDGEDNRYRITDAGRKALLES
jgi:DNA-binding MarR family transcriptional regulator